MTLLIAALVTLLTVVVVCAVIWWVRTLWEREVARAEIAQAILARSMGITCIVCHPLPCILSPERWDEPRRD